MPRPKYHRHPNTAASYRNGWRKRRALLAHEMIGQTFGRLTVISLAPSRKSGNGGTRWKCLCECGAKTISRGTSLRAGESRSCGCLQRERATASIVQRSTKHGHAARYRPSAEYRSWQAMHRRCSNKNDNKYKYYGGRGIRVCKKWKSFEHFLADMGPKPTLKHSIDRINSNGIYAPKNCRWATSVEQNNNKRRS